MCKVNGLRLFFFYLNALSIDIAIVAAIGFISINKIFAIPTRPELLTLLFFGTFLVYWFDHFRDIQIYGKNISRRHYLLSKIRIPLFFLSLLFVLISILLVVNNFQRIDFLFSFFLFLGMLVYLYFHQNLNKWILLKKEILISFLYSFSVFFQVFMAYPENIWVVFCFLVLTVFYEVISISKIESEFDLVHQIPNINTGFKMKKAITIFLYVLPILTFIFMLFSGFFVGYFAILLLIQLLHLAMFKLFKNLKFIQSNYRILSEWSFGLQILIFLF